MRVFRLLLASPSAIALGIGVVFYLSACLVAPGKATPVDFTIGKSSLAYGIFETRATLVTVEAHHDFPASFKTSTDITIDDGTNIVTFELGNLKPSLIHAMPAGLKRVTITGGGQVMINGEVFGLYVDKITFNDRARRIFPASDRIWIYGDSLAIGGDVKFASRQAWPVLLRKRFEVSLEAYGYRMLYDDASTPDAMQRLVSRARLFSPKYIWLAIGTNDYAFNPWSAPEFGSAYKSLLNALHEAVPGAIVFAQSPIRRADEGTVGIGSALDAYRDQIRVACDSSLEWCTFVDGRNPLFPQLDEIAKDGVHLTTMSNIKYAETVLKTIMDEK